MMRKSLAALVLFSSLCVVPGVGAQAIDMQAAAGAAASSTQQQSIAVQAGISREAIVRFNRTTEPTPANTTLALQSRERRGRTLMIVGGAAFLAGLIIGDEAGNAIAIGGALVGIYGLYLWAQTQP